MHIPSLMVSEMRSRIAFGPDRPRDRRRVGFRFHHAHAEYFSVQTILFLQLVRLLPSVTSAMFRLVLIMYLGFGNAAVLANTGRLPPSISHQATLSLFESGRYAQAFAAALHRYEWGDEDLHYELAVMYHGGLGTAVNLRLAREHFQLSAQQGRIEGMYRLARMQHLGEAGPMDRITACQWYLRAADAGHLDAIYQYGRCAFDGPEAGSDPQQGAAWLHRAALRQHTGALKLLLFHYQRRPPGSSRPKANDERPDALLQQEQAAAAAERATQAILKGDYRAYGSLAEALRRLGSAPDDVIDTMYQIGALFGSPMPIFGRAMIHQSRGEKHRACQGFLRAHEQGLAAAGYELGRCYQQGTLAHPEAQARACDIFQQVATQGHGRAALAYAHCLAEAPGADIAHFAQAIEQYVAAVAALATLQDRAFANHLANQFPQGQLAASSTLSADGVALPAGTPVHMLTRNADRMRVFAPDFAQIGDLRPAQLRLHLDIHGLILPGLNRTEARALLNEDAGLEALKLSALEDRLRVADDPRIELRIRYDSAGQAIQLTRITENGTEPGLYLERLEALGLLIGRSQDEREQALYRAAHWKIQGWSILLMQNLVQGGLQERYSLIEAEPAD